MIDNLMAATSTYYVASFEEDIINTQKILMCFVECLNKGLPPIDKRRDQNANKFVELFAQSDEEILHRLLEGGNQPNITLDVNQYRFTLQERNNAVSVSLKTGRNEVTQKINNTSLTALVRNFVIDVIRHGHNYSRMVVNTALNHVMFNAGGSDAFSTRHAVLCILKSADDETTRELKLAAAKHVLQNDQDYSLRTFKLVIDMIIRNRKDCLMPLVLEAEHILLDAEYHSSKQIGGALIFLFNCPDNTTTLELKLAAAYHIFQRAQDYSKSTIECMIKMILRQPNDCQLAIIEASEDILINPADYSAESILGALNFLLYCPDEETSTALKEAAAKHICQQNQNYSRRIITGIAEMVIRNSEGCQYMHLIDAAQYILRNDDEYASTSVQSACVYIAYHAAQFQIDFVKLAAEKHVFQHNQNYSGRVTAEIAEMIIRNSDGCEKMSPIDAAKYILINDDECTPISIQSACIHIVGNADLLPIDFFNYAANLIGLNTELFPQTVITAAAIEFTQQNETFFIAPTRNNQEFTNFFVRHSAMKILKQYSDQLCAVLCANTTAHPVDVAGNISQYKTNFALWNSRHFVDVLTNSKDVAQFILQNVQHPAITLWNAQHEVNNNNGRRHQWEKNKIISHSEAVS